MKNIAKALLEVQKGLDSVHKGKSGYGYKYADLPAVMASCLDSLNAHGILLIQAPCVSLKQAAAIETRFIHAESGEEITGVVEVPWAVGNTKMSDAQAYGSSMTYAKRYALVSMLGIVTEDDDALKTGNSTKTVSVKDDSHLIALYKTQIHNCTSLPELKEQWEEITKNGLGTNKELLGLKDKRKGELA